MTALPDTPSLSPITSKEAAYGVVMRPNVTEHFWGFEVRPNASVVTLGELLRVSAGLASVSAGLAALGVWVLPQMALAGELIATKAFVSAVLVMLAVICAQIAARGSRVRVHIDTSKGELREVVDGAVNGPVVLARYGLDSVEAVEVVASSTDPSFGQVQLTFAGGWAIAAGDGDLSVLKPLRDRIRAACHMEPTVAPKPAIWTGPLAA